MKIQLVKPEHEVAYQDLCQLMSRHAASMTALELLAVASNMLGKLVAMQDQRIVSKDLVLRVIAANLEKGNQAVVEKLLSETMGSA